jgi:hypothetical protein
MYRQTERGPRYSNASSPTRNRSPRRKAFRLILLVTTLRRCSPCFTPTPLSLDIVEVLGRDEGRFADPAEAAPVPGTGAVAVTLQAATLERGGRPNALHLRTSSRRKENAFHEARHHQYSFESYSAFRRVFRYPEIIVS